MSMLQQISRAGRLTQARTHFRRPLSLPRVYVGMPASRSCVKVYSRAYIYAFVFRCMCPALLALVLFFLLLDLCVYLKKKSSTCAREFFFWQEFYRSNVRGIGNSQSCKKSVRGSDFHSGNTNSLVSIKKGTGGAVARVRAELTRH